MTTNKDKKIRIVYEYKGQPGIIFEIGTARIGDVVIKICEMFNDVKGNEVELQMTLFLKDQEGGVFLLNNNNILADFGISPADRFVLKSLLTEEDQNRVKDKIKLWGLHY